MKGFKFLNFNIYYICFYNFVQKNIEIYRVRVKKNYR